MPNNVSLKTEKQPHQPPSAAEAPVMMTWKTPWTRSHLSGISPPVPITRQSSLGVEHERLLRKTETRQVSLELLEARSNKRSFDLKHRHDRRELTELRHEKEELLRSRASLEKELGEAMADLKRFRHKQWKLSEAFKKQAVLLSIEKDIRKDVEEELERCRAAMSTPKPKIARRVSWSDTVDEISNNSDSSTEPILGGPTGPLLHELLEHVRSSLTGTVSRWVKGMLAACAREIKEALILPWLLHKLFFLCNELVHSKREELVNVFLGGRLESMGENAIGDIDAHMDPTTAEFMHRHIRRHHLTLFPLAGDELKSAVNRVMKALAKSMTDCKEWDPKARNPEAVRGALAASGLEQIVREYLHILVYCCLQSPALTFSNDLGKVERYNPQVHSEPIDGEPADEFCVVVFPALIAVSDSTRWGENEFMSPRYVLSSEGSID